MNSKVKTTVLVVLLAVIVITAMITNFYMDWVWFASVNKLSVFLTIFFSQVALRLVVGIGLFLLFMGNFLVTRRSLMNFLQGGDEPARVIRKQKPFWEVFLQGRGLIIFFLLLSFILAYIISLLASQDWMVVQQYFHAGSFEVVDPIFYKDIGFYVFKLPFYQMIYNYLIGGMLATAIIVGLIYIVSSPSAFFRNPLGDFTRPKIHFSVLIALFFLIKAWGYKLSTYELLFSSNGVVYGASYADIHGRLLAYQSLEAVAVICAVLILANLFIRKIKWVLLSIVILISASLLLGYAYPGMIQNFRVVPNQFAMEEPYINYTIEYTKKGYNLDNIKRVAFPADNNLTTQMVKDNQDTIENVRLWDWQPLKQTYGQIQEMRPYYGFKDIDIDRYHLNGELRQVALAAREIDQTKLPEQAQTWINQRLKYTHGYGMAMSPVNEVTPEGLPEFYIQNIPPETDKAGIPLERPEIYYGETNDSYVIVNAATPEFNYPKGDENVESYYQETGGIMLSSPFCRSMFAMGLGDYKLLLSNEVNSQSQLLYYRNIHERVRKIAPFLRFDEDPYLVVSQGRLYWIQDAYTTSDRYPYSEPTEGWGNYVRNSVKVVIDAYNGSTDFYITDEDDPIVRSYQLIFPRLFQPIDNMPPDIKRHLRYPEDLFNLQASIYSTYHMEDPLVFYNKEDKWSIPEELFGGKKETMKPYYMVMKLPGESQPEFLLMLPFTPAKRENMVGWLCARSDGERYGQMLVYHFPKQKLVYGPMQIEARIEQDGEISKELSLWNQKGSSTFRGNIMVIPIEHSIIYVEPLYLQADQSRLPELRRVVVVYGDQVVMDKTLEAALEMIFKEVKPPPAPPVPPAAEEGTLPNTLSVQELVKSARQTYNEAQKKLSAGDWAGYGESIKELDAILKELERTTGAATTGPTTTERSGTNPR
ncbi:MAG: UPF0182 family protein [Firmicutes bacterium]|nr:UPF0182 family protein [Bacillota bacterium]